MMRWRPLAAWLAERTDVSDADYVAREHACGCAQNTMEAYRQEAADLQAEVAALARKISRLNGELNRLLTDRGGRAA